MGLLNYSILAGFSSLGNEQLKISEHLVSEGDNHHAWRHKQSETKRRIISTGLASQKEVASKESKMDKSKK